MVSLTTWGAMPQVPPSPTLTNPDMILPDLSDGQDSTPSPRLRSQRPPSPPSHLLRQSFQLAKPPPSRRSGSNSRPSTSSRMAPNNHFEGFDGDFDGDTTPKGQTRQDDDAVRGTPRTNVMHNWQRDMERKALESARSGDADSELYSAGFDGAHADSDGSGSADDSDGRYGSLPYVAGSDDDTDNEQWLDGQEELDLEAISSAALSKRAEMILANAKKRLNLMEGNLRGARQSLLPPQRPPSYTSYHYYKRASSISPTPRGSGPVYIPQAKHASFQTPPLSSSGSPGHARVHSEISVSSPPDSAFSHRSQPPEKRAVSAMGRFSGQWSPHDFSLGHTVGNRSSGLRGVRSQEVIRHTWVTPEQHNLRSLSRTSNYQASPTLETLREDEDYNKSGTDLRRSASTTSDLRAQMQDLKGRISSLKERAREDGMKRRSLQNLRTPSPFTASRMWDSGTDQYANGTSPYSSSRGSDQVNGMSNESSPVEVRNGGFHERESAYQNSQYEDAEEKSSEAGSDETRVLDDLEEAARDEADYAGDDHEVDGESIYEDAPQVVAERHEDRADAFDYEHFFLHSAMGTYTRENRSMSVSSEDSVETTRPASPPPKVPALPESALSPHRRTRSQESISTVATFQTATEGHSSGSDGESEESNEALDQFTEQALGRRLPPKASNQSLRSTSSAPRQLRSAGSFYSQHTSSSGQRQLRSAGSFYSQNIHSSGDSTPDITSDPTARILASFFSPHKERGQLTPLKQKDEDLLYALTTSIQQVCSRLQYAQDDDYETKIWRRRLDAARKILDGVPNEDA